MRTYLATTLIASVLLAGCGEREAEAPKPAIAGDLAIEPWTLPTVPGSAQPDLALAPDGRVLLSWINTQPGRRPAFQFAELYPDGRWQGPRTIAVGNAMFVNWADTPHIAATADRALWAHWLQKSADAPYAYDVMLVRSLDHGMNWSAPQIAHDDGTISEHGFVSFWPQGQDALGVAWLDGRNTAESSTDSADAQSGHDGKHSDQHGAGHGGGMMSLRGAVFDARLGTRAAAEIDASTCDCCQTDAVPLGKGALLVYRDRTEQEIRDIYAVRFDGETWSKPVRVHADDWKMPACPVNGPSVAALDQTAVVGWYTVSDDQPAVKLARSTDGGARFADPVVVDRGEAVQGRVAVAVDAGETWIVWLREEAGQQSLWLARYAPDLKRELQRVKLADVQGHGRATGFPRLLLAGSTAYVVWTDVVDAQPRLNGLRIVGSARPSAGG